jgi:hypothetical protein
MSSDPASQVCAKCGHHFSLDDRRVELKTRDSKARCPNSMCKHWSVVDAEVLKRAAEKRPQPPS